MPDKQNKAEHTHDSANQPEDSIPAEANPTQAAQNTETTQANDTMEVHHHAHHNHGKKSWKAYFWEFFMLFLAVFCGFLAEYQLEHKIENDREKIYIKNLLEDLKDDMKSYVNHEKSISIYQQKTDSLFLFLKSPANNNDLHKMYFLAREMTIASIHLIPNQRTFEQMKNSGHLRLIHNRKTANAISVYYLFLQGIIDQNGVLQDRLTAYQNEIGNLFDAATLWQIFKTRSLPAGNQLRLLTQDQVMINRYLTSLQYLMGSRIRQNDRAVEAAKKCSELIHLIKEEYDLD